MCRRQNSGVSPNESLPREFVTPGTQGAEVLRCNVLLSTGHRVSSASVVKVPVPLGAPRQRTALFRVPTHPRHRHPRGDRRSVRNMSPFGERFESAHVRFREQNGQDPNRVVVDGKERPREQVAAERLVEWVKKLAPQGSEALQLAAGCQHLRRWEIPRGSYEAGRLGYLRWRKDLGRFHADEAAKILRSVGYDEPTVEAVRQINMKLGLQTNPDCATMEDALCLSFLEHEYGDFADKHPDDKVVDIVRKTWKKMTEQGRSVALTLPLGGRAGELVRQALS